jgi:hypothetical protein
MKEKPRVAINETKTPGLKLLLITTLVYKYRDWLKLIWS